MSKLREVFDLTDTNSGHIWLFLCLVFLGLAVCAFCTWLGDRNGSLFEVGKNLTVSGLSLLGYAMKAGNKSEPPPSNP
jgi:hypothetical protein